MRWNWASKSTIIALIFLTAFLGQQKFRQYRLQQEIKKEKQNLQAQSGELESKNLELQKTLSYLNSEGYKELVARQQLNMQKDGEIVYSFSEGPAPEQAGVSEDNKSNFQKWVDFFLNKKNERN